MSPGRIRAEDLHKEDRAKLVGRGERRHAPARPRPAIDVDDDELAPSWTCHNCGAVFTRYAAAERHGNTPGHRRIAFNLEGDL